MSNIFTYYEDYSFSMNENMVDTELSVCKKRKIHAEEKDIIQKNIIKEKPIINNSNGYEKSEDEQQNEIYNQKHYNALTSARIQLPNLSDSDSNDTFSTINDKALVYKM